MAGHSFRDENWIHDIYVRQILYIIPSLTKYFRYLKWRNPHLHKLYGYGLCKGKPAPPNSRKSASLPPLEVPEILSEVRGVSPVNPTFITPVVIGYNLALSSSINSSISFIKGGGLQIRPKHLTTMPNSSASPLQTTKTRFGTVLVFFLRSYETLKFNIATKNHGLKVWKMYPLSNVAIWVIYVKFRGCIPSKFIFPETNIVT